MDNARHQLPEPPRLMSPTEAVRESWLAGEQADCDRYGTSTDVLDEAAENFEEFVVQRQGVRIGWNVPVTTFWYISGEHYIGELVIRHELTPELMESGGHIGYNVVTPW